jgi:CheY-like chemotaxis protein
MSGTKADAEGRQGSVASGYSDSNLGGPRSDEAARARGAAREPARPLTGTTPASATATPVPATPHGSAEGRSLVPWKGVGRVLVVDDEPSVARLTALVLDQYGFEVDVAISGLDALEHIARKPAGFRLIVVDLSMPDLSGVDVLKRARELGCQAPMVLTSGHSSTDTDGVLRTSDFAGYLQKPYRLETLLEVIQQALLSSAAPVG